MSLFISIAGFVVFAAVVALVLAHHWNERHGDNHF
jgi:hypothetical protein